MYTTLFVWPCLMQEAMTPLNQKDILKAAKATGRVIPVQIYLYSHYEQPYGYNFTTSKQLKDLVSSLDPKLVRVVGECVTSSCCLLAMLGMHDIKPQALLGEQG